MSETKDKTIKNKRVPKKKQEAEKEITVVDLDEIPAKTNGTSRHDKKKRQFSIWFWITLPIRVLWNIIKSIVAFVHAIVFVLALCLIAGIVCAGLVYMHYRPMINECLEKAYDVQSAMQMGDFHNGEKTYIYDIEGNTIGIVNTGYFEYVDISEISKHLQDLYISQEDVRFKTHFGVDPISIVRAGVELIRHNGEVTQGGSTITQQLIKNVYLTQEKSFERKIVEILTAPRLEITFSKPKIMEFYCNTNYYANRCYGVQAASLYYFGKNAKDLSIAEAATLVGISNVPAKYDPVAHPEESKEKRDQVIRKACKNGFITEEEQDEALEEPFSIEQNKFPENMETYGSTYAVHCAALEFMKKDNFRFQYVFSNKADYDKYMEKYGAAYQEATEHVKAGGYEIHTSLNPVIQDLAQTAVDTSLANFTELQDNGKFAMQGSMVVVDNKTGYVVAVVGGRGTEDQFNRSYLMARQPGSCIKPLIAYGPAFDTLDYYPGKIMNDHEFENGPKNSGGRYYGDITIRQALNRSLNTVAWQILDEIGVNTGLDYLGQMKFHKLSYIDYGVNALAIGGFTNGARPVDMAKGYQTLANNGIYDNKTCIKDITDRDGNIVIDGEKLGSYEVYEPDTAYMLTDILKGTFTAEGGTAHGLSVSGDMPCAGKTGTTNASKDTWFCGYTKYYTAAVWIGYDTPRDMPGTYGRDYAGHIWQDVMNHLHAGLEPEDWVRPDTVIMKEINGITDLYSTESDTRAAQRLEEQRQERIYNEANAGVTDYEKFTINSVADTYNLEEPYIRMKNAIASVEDPEKRAELADRIEAKHDELLAVVEDMKADIEYYEARAKIEAEQAEQERNEKAEQERKEEIMVVRRRDMETTIKELKELEYRPTTIDSMVREAQEKLRALEGDEEYQTYADQLVEAIEYAGGLHSYQEWQEIKRREEEERQAREEEERRRAEEEIRRAMEEANMTGEEPGSVAEPETQSENWGPGGYSIEETPPVVTPYYQDTQQSAGSGGPGEQIGPGVIYSAP